MSIPLLDLKPQHEPIQREMCSSIEKLICSPAVILGPEVAEFERRIAAYCQTRFAVGVSSGTDALLVSLMALGLGPDDEVITTPYSFIATASVIVRVGARPVFVDIEPVSFNIDPERIEPAITSRTKAIIPVHLYGQCAEMDPILGIAKKHSFAVVEDAAQAIGAQYRDGRRCGSMGDLGCLSFYPTKNLGALGDAGMVLTNNEETAKRVQLLRVQGAKPKYYHSVVGGNFRLDTLQAAILNVKLNYLDSWTAQRQDNARQYESLFRTSGLTEQIGLRLPNAVYDGMGLSHYHIYNQFVIRVPDRDRLRLYLQQEGIATEVYYPVPFHLQECFRYLGYREGDFPVSEQAAKESLALPIYPGLTSQQQETVVAKIQEFLGAQ